ncbi:MAG: HAD family hydrolase [Candidatus Nanohaloarchaea archaeon]|nr:HAD family hydrolase [Candidatus Nanohaloarchaea archaeon]
MAYDSVIFDNDGVLLDIYNGPDRFDEEIKQLLAGFGVLDPDEDDVETLTRIGNPEDQREVCEKYGIDFAEFWRRRERRSLEYQQEMIEEGKRQLYTDFNAVELLYENLPLAVVSNNQRDFVSFILQRFRVDYLFETVYGREPDWRSLQRLKPDAHYIQQAMEDLGVSDPLYVGDSGVDVEAAQNAGIDVAFIRRPHRDGYELYHEPTHKIASLHDLLDLI